MSVAGTKRTSRAGLAMSVDWGSKRSPGEPTDMSRFRHGRACPGHPRLSCLTEAKTWMPGTRPGMTSFVGRISEA
jgi:hypothetical protein